MLNNLRIRTKLIAAFSILLILMCVIFAISYNRIKTINEKMTEITDVNAVQLQLIGDIESIMGMEVPLRQIQPTIYQVAA